MGMPDAGVGLSKKSGTSRVGIKSSLLMAILVFFIHLFIVVLLLNDRGVKPGSASELILQVHLLSPDKRKSVSPSIIDSYIPPQPAAIAIKNLQLPAIAIEEIASKPGVTELSPQQESTIFDPRLRKKLSDLGSRLASQPTPELKRWTDPSGVQIVEVKQGECIRAMPGDANARGDNWSLRFNCGKSEGERMIDSVNADIAERKRKGHGK